MRWTQPLEHLSIIFIFVIVGFLMNFLQLVAFLLFWHLNRGIYRDLVHVRSRVFCFSPRIPGLKTILGVPVWPLVNCFVDWISLFGLKIENYLL